MLIASRVLQGLFGAVMLPQGLGLIKEMFPPHELGKAFGMFGPVMTISSVGGPVLASWLVDADFFGTGWRMIFLIKPTLPPAHQADLVKHRTKPPLRTRIPSLGLLVVCG
ncbi:MFS transporter [Nonomuraea candida]|uniref:MFS transporter n=1 Tax=Nonomuraea candida TaxID=359159 RepID=UPI0005B7CB94